MAANKERDIKLNVKVNGSDAEKTFDQLNKDIKDLLSSIKKTNAAGKAFSLGSESIRTIQQIKSSFRDILTTRGTIRKEALKDVDKLQKRFNEFFSSLNKDVVKSASNASKQFKKISEEAQKSLGKTTSVLGGSKNAAFGKALGTFKYRLGNFLTYRIISSVTNAVDELASSAVKLDAEFANIQAITSSSDETMEKLRDTILRVGEASKYTVEEIAQSTVQLGQAGLSAEEINDVLETTTQLAAATGSELSNTVDLMTSSLAVWGLNSQEASHLSDVMVTGMNRTKATLETFRMAVQYAGATAASLNVSFEEMASVASAAANAGLRASVVGTGLRATMAELISPTKKMTAGLEAMGLTTEDVDIASRGLVPVLKSLRDAGLDASNAYDLFGRRAATFVLAVQGQLDKIDELQAAFKEQGATLKAYNKQMNTVSAQATALGNTIKAIASDILKSFDDKIIGFLKFCNEALTGLRRFVSEANLELKRLFVPEEGKSSFKTALTTPAEFEEGYVTPNLLKDLRAKAKAKSAKSDKSVKSAESVKPSKSSGTPKNLEDMSDQSSGWNPSQGPLSPAPRKTTWEEGVAGFSEQVQQMKSAYTSAEIGKTIAEDLGDGMSDALYSITSGAKSMKDAFKDLAVSVLQEIQKMIIKMMVLRALEGVVEFVGGAEDMSGQSSGWNPAAGAPAARPTAANGGFATRLRAATGSLVRGGIQGRDSVPAVLMPGEYVLKKSAVDALGTNFLNDLNNNAAQTLTNTASSMLTENPWETQDSEPAVVNVWVVSKEEEAKMGPNDIIATISKDIMVGGQTRRLIQSVVAGRK